ncbi:hypothetical protein CsSME_00014309 [Camellia sinensis var. sinensis]
MANDAAFRSCLVWLAVIVAVVGLCTQSLRKMMATYLLGMFAVAGVLLPDWEFFDRHVSRWSSPVSFHDMRQQQPHSASAQRVPTTPPPTRSTSLFNSLFLLCCVDLKYPSKLILVYKIYILIK